MNGKLETLKHEVADIEFDGETLVFRFHSGIYVDEDGAKSLVETANEMIGERAPAPTIVHIGRVKGVSKAARDFFSTSEMNLGLSTAAALIVSSPIARIVANIFMGLNKPKHPIRLFKSEQSAREWFDTLS